MLCPTCSREMRMVGLIDEREVIERILRHLGLWKESVRLNPVWGVPRTGRYPILTKPQPFPTPFSMKPLSRRVPQPPEKRFSI